MMFGRPQNTLTMPPPKCAKCGGDMRERFVPGSADAARWIPALPEVNFMGATRIEGKEQHFIVTFRCNKCDYLDSYAPGK